MKSISLVTILGIFFLITGCGTNKYNKLKTFTAENTVNAVIEIPSGTNHKIEYDEISSSFTTNSRGDKERIVSYLPYIGNYGFVANTTTKKSEHGDGDPIDILLLSSHQKTGAVIPSKPIALLKLIDNNELDYKVIALPVKQAADVLKVDNLKQLQKTYPGVTEIIELWFKNYDQVDENNIIGWGDEKEALAYINANITNQNSNKH